MRVFSGLVLKFEISTSLTMPFGLQSTGLTVPLLVHAEESPANGAGPTEQNHNNSSRCRRHAFRRMPQCSRHQLFACAAKSTAFSNCRDEIDVLFFLPNESFAICLWRCSLQLRRHDIHLGLVTSAVRREAASSCLQRGVTRHRCGHAHAR